MRPHCGVLVVLDRRQWSHQNIMIGQLTTKHKHYTDQIFRRLVAIFNLNWWQDDIVYNQAMLYLAVLTDVEL